MRKSIETCARLNGRRLSIDRDDDDALLHKLMIHSACDLSVANTLIYSLYNKCHTGLYSFMMDTAPTLGSIDTTRAQKRKFAQESLDFNVRDTNFCKLFPEYVELQKELAAERRSLQGEATVTDEAASVAVGERAGELHGILAGAAGVLAIVSIFFAMRFL